jgi:hypothetical protein
MRITLHIDRLVLDGVQVEHADVARLCEALEQQLAQHLRRGGLEPNLLCPGTFTTLSGAAITARSGSVPSGALAEQIAGAVYAAIGNDTLRSPSPAPPAGEACPEPGRRGWGEGSEKGRRKE